MKLFATFYRRNLNLYGPFLNIFDAKSFISGTGVPHEILPFHFWYHPLRTPLIVKYKTLYARISDKNIVYGPVQSLIDLEIMDDMIPEKGMLVTLHFGTHRKDSALTKHMWKEYRDGIKGR